MNQIPNIEEVHNAEVEEFKKEFSPESCRGLLYETIYKALVEKVVTIYQTHQHQLQQAREEVKEQLIEKFTKLKEGANLRDQIYLDGVLAVIETHHSKLDQDK